MQKIAFHKVQSELLKEAQASPNLLSDLAGLESYIAETYNNRSFIELLQNADDADASSFYINLIDDCLIVANNGRSFNENDLLSLCRSAASTKTRGSSIGFRGIGFKSIVGFAHDAHLISGDYRISFSREETKKLVPFANNVPLIRIPHPINKDIVTKYNAIIDSLLSNGYNTVFCFTNLDKHVVNLELEEFNPNILLFLNKVSYVEIISNNKVLCSTNKTRPQTSFREVVKMNNAQGENTMWRLYKSAKCMIAFRCDMISGNIEKIDVKNALVSSFLPTEELTGMGFLVNGDFATDPSRRHIILNDDSLEVINCIAKSIVSIINEIVSNYSEDNKFLLNAIIPFSDPKLLQYKKSSFEKCLIEKIREYGFSVFSKLSLSPKWLNIKDFDNLAHQSSITTIDRRYYEVDGALTFLKYLGANEVSLLSICNMDISTISDNGCAQIIKHIIQSSIPTYQISKKEYVKLNVIVYKNKRYSFDNLASGIEVDTDFIDILSNNGILNSDLKYFLKKNASIEFYNRTCQYIDRDNNNSVSKNEALVSITPSDDQKDLSIIYPTTSVADINIAVNNWLKTAKQNRKAQSVVNTRWRSSEVQAREVLNSIGFQLDDVSKQNIGFDLEGLDPNGNNVMIEVKSIKNSSDKIEMTNNEVALAQEQKGNYYLAIIKLLGDGVELMLVADPIHNLNLIRQAVQWKWVCDKYEYEPIKFTV